MVPAFFVAPPRCRRVTGIGHRGHGVHRDRGWRGGGRFSRDDYRSIGPLLRRQTLAEDDGVLVCARFDVRRNPSSAANPVRPPAPTHLLGGDFELPPKLPPLSIGLPPLTTPSSWTHLNSLLNPDRLNPFTIPPPTTHTPRPPSPIPHHSPPLSLSPLSPRWQNHLLAPHSPRAQKRVGDLLADPSGKFRRPPPRGG